MREPVESRGSNTSCPTRFATHASRSGPRIWTHTRWRISHDEGRYRHDEGRYAEAEKLDRETLDIRRRVLGPEHPVTLTSMNNLAIVLADEGRYAEAEKLDRHTGYSSPCLGAGAPSNTLVDG
jgi:hypothetical protein